MCRMRPTSRPSAWRPRRKGRGLGTALLVALLDEAQRRGVAHVDLEVKADNDTARRLYERHGFTEIAVRRNYYQPSGTDAIVMRKELADERRAHRARDRDLV